MKNITLIIFYFVLFGMYGQKKESILLDSAHTKKTISDSKWNPSVYEVEEKILKHKKRAFTLQGVIDPSSLSGVFLEMDKYFVMKDTHTNYSKDELVLEKRIKELGVSKRHITNNVCSTLIVNLETGKHYFVANNFLYNLDYTQINKDQNRQSYLEKTRKFALSKTIDVTYPLDEFESLIEECRMYTNKLKEHNTKSKNGKMSRTEIREWKRDIVAAKLLDFRISDFVEAYKNADLENHSDYINPLAEYNLFSKTLIVAHESSEL